ncbi:hypothetical protein HHI36_012912 [Cryptolaemus montrouzieri]|uniref:Uncharacterized protein n=1 Tax=Cryptolaemus montrouzieri TaxID=559131 RepID=A0ABD2NG67_9CUCU
MKITKDYKNNNWKFCTRAKTMRRGKNREIFGMRDRCDIWTKQYGEKFMGEIRREGKYQEEEGENQEMDGVEIQFDEAIRNIKTGKAGGRGNKDQEMIE